MEKYSYITPITELWVYQKVKFLSITPKRNICMSDGARTVCENMCLSAA